MFASLFHTLNISRQDMMTRLTDLDVVSHNLANVNTSGYKSNRSNFQELLAGQYKEGTSLSSTQILTGQGALNNSTNPLDWAIQGNGFFAVKLADGRTAYTRDGQFSLDANRNLVTGSGFKLVWSGQVPQNATDLSIHGDGTVEATLADGTHTVAGTVQLARFANPTGLLAYGDNVYLESKPSGVAQMSAAGSANTGTISSHVVEQSNVDVGQQMTQMMVLQRAFQMSTRTFQQTDTMISEAINMRKA
jgi:flagellar basal-body rod protein FlgG